MRGQALVEFNRDLRLDLHFHAFDPFERFHGCGGIVMTGGIELLERLRIFQKREEAYIT